VNKSSYTIAQLAALTGATVVGSDDIIISEVGTINDALPHQVTFLANPLYRKYLPSTKAGVVVLTAADAEECPTNALISPNPYATYARIAQLLYPMDINISEGIHPTAIISETAKIAENVTIGAHAVIGDNVVIENDVVIGASCSVGVDCFIGAHSLLYPNVTLYSDVRLGQRTVIHSGTVIGSDGFGFANDKGRWIKVPQVGGVVIGDEVEIGANTTIDRGALGDTVIEDNVKIDNQVQIGHNAMIGAHTVIAGCVGISGSAKIGRYCMIGGGTGVAGHIEVCDKVVVTGMTMLTRSISQPGLYSSGTGLDTNARWKKNAARFRNLDELAKRIQQLERALAAVNEKLA
jgi:UDP-3-O-[3-hydroxymyristoyl] glucosamine N-acyltransferase